MTPEKTPAKKLTVDDLRSQAMKVRDQTVDEVQELANMDASRYVAIAAIVFAVGVSLAFYLGSRSRR